MTWHWSQWNKLANHNKQKPRSLYFQRFNILRIKASQRWRPLSHKLSISVSCEITCIRFPLPIVCEHDASQTSTTMTKDEKIRTTSTRSKTYDESRLFYTHETYQGGNINNKIQVNGTTDGLFSKGPHRVHITKLAYRLKTTECMFCGHHMFEWP